MNKKIISSGILVFIVIAAGWYSLSKNPAGGSGVSATVALVDGTPITQGQLVAAESSLAAQQGMTATSTVVQTQFQSNALDLLIGQVLLKQAAVQAGFTASSTEVDAQLASIKAGFSTPDAYQQALAAQKMTESDLRSQISDDLSIKAFLNKQLNLASMTASDAEVQALYDHIAAQQTGTSTPPLSAVRDQVAQMVVQQKQQQSVGAYVAQLRSTANVQILIATSTPSV